LVVRTLLRRACAVLILVLAAPGGLEAQGTRYQSRGAHFRVAFEGPGDDLMARRVVEQLEAVYWRVGGQLRTFPPEPIEVVLYTTERFRDVTRAPAWVGAVYDGRIHLPVKGALEQLTQLDRVLTHEFVHATVAMVGGRSVPLWLNEGLATALEPGGAAEAEAFLRASPTRPSLQQLHRSFLRLNADEARIAYAQSAHAVRRILRTRGPAAVVSLLRDIAAGADFAAAFHQRTAMRYDEFDAIVQRD
jgi:hypothetical protein